MPYLRAHPTLYQSGGNCGMRELVGLDYDHQHTPMTENCPYPRADLKNAIAACINTAKEQSQGLIIATTNPKQLQAAEVLKECGFEQAAYFHNPNSGNDCRVWILNLDPVKE